MGLQATIRTSGDVTIVEFEGRVLVGPDNDRLAADLQGLLTSGVRKLLVNLTRVTQMDSSGISTLARAFVALGKSGGSQKLAGASGRVRDVLSVTRLLSAIPNFDEEAAALAASR